VADPQPRPTDQVASPTGQLLGLATVDRALCYSYGACVDVLPEVFELDEHGISVVLVVVPSPVSVLIEAAEQCPMEAIAVVIDGNTVYPGD